MSESPKKSTIHMDTHCAYVITVGMEDGWEPGGGVSR